ncbi:hypothetical protein CHU98_g12125, partial [Xylaria longipes]
MKRCRLRHQAAIGLQQLQGSQSFPAHLNHIGRSQNNTFAHYRLSTYSFLPASPFCDFTIQHSRWQFSGDVQICIVDLINAPYIHHNAVNSILELGGRRLTRVLGLWHYNLTDRKWRLHFAVSHTSPHKHSDIARINDKLLVPKTMATPGTSKRLSEQEWVRHELTIRQLYLEKDSSLHSVMSKMADEHGFNAT